ncbi:MAG: xanthine dehydrogenase family protein subunit M, partial [Thermogemmatispora sp.]|nr:xanthine dehydrogenase family protein subunit M [Thermogemmatispora sp.]
AEAASHAAEGLELMEDIHGSKQYRAQMAAVMARRAILKAAERARG